MKQTWNLPSVMTALANWASRSFWSAMPAPNFSWRSISPSVSLSSSGLILMTSPVLRSCVSKCCKKCKTTTSMTPYADVLSPSFFDFQVAVLHRLRHPSLRHTNAHGHLTLAALRLWFVRCFYHPLYRVLLPALLHIPFPISQHQPSSSTWHAILWLAIDSKMKVTAHVWRKVQPVSKLKE